MEWAAAFERLLQFAHTGNGRVLPSAFFRALGITEALQLNSWPTFSSLVKLGQACRVTIEVKHWPQASRGHDSYLSPAYASIKFHYSDATANVSPFF